MTNQEAREAAAPTPYERLRWHYGIPDELINEYRASIQQDDLLDRMREALRAYERWEASVIMTDECWAPDGMAPLPRLTQALWDQLIEIQGQRNAILAEADAKAQEEQG